MENIDAIVAAVQDVFPDLIPAIHQVFQDERYDLLIIIMTRIISVLETDRALGAHLDYQNGSELLHRFLYRCAPSHNITPRIAENVEMYCHELWKIWRNDIFGESLARRRSRPRTF
jgi:hypothetical protein